ncbi:MAG: hypothetical protein JW838_00765 [Spirochaetes bacterium]|nr:hypothetical protein [Spirochaetota bacterium]
MNDAKEQGAPGDMTVTRMAIDGDSLVLLTGTIRNIDMLTMMVEMAEPEEGLRLHYPLLPINAAEVRYDIRRHGGAGAPFLVTEDGSISPFAREAAGEVLARIHEVVLIFTERRDEIAAAYRRYYRDYDEATGGGALEEVRAEDRSRLLRIIEDFEENPDRFSGTSVERYLFRLPDLAKSLEGTWGPSILTAGPRVEFRDFLVRTGTIIHFREVHLIRELIRRHIGPDDDILHHL